MAELPLVSICIPVLNGEQHVIEAIDSALRQTYPNCEVVVLDNASSDSTAELVRAAASNSARIRYFRNPATLGMVENFNLAVSKAEGVWIKLLPHDDVLSTGSIEKMMSCAAPGRHFLVGLRGFIFERAGLLQKFFYHRQNCLGRADRRFGVNPVSPQQYLENVSVNPCHNLLGEPGSILFSAHAFEQVGGFEPGFQQLCDLQFWHKLGANFGLQVVPYKVALFRVHASSASSINKRDGFARSLEECLKLSALILEDCQRLGSGRASRRAVVNYLLDWARYNRFSQAPLPGGMPVPRLNAALENILRQVVALPGKRFYQLLCLRLIYPLFSFFGTRASFPN